MLAALIVLLAEGPFALFWSGSSTYLVDAGEGRLYQAPHWYAGDDEGRLYQYRMRIKTFRHPKSIEGEHWPASRWTLLEQVEVGVGVPKVLTPEPEVPPPGEGHLHDEFTVVQFRGETATLVERRRVFGPGGIDTHTSVWTVLLPGNLDERVPPGSVEAVEWLGRHLPDFVGDCLTHPAGVLTWELPGGDEVRRLALGPGRGDCAAGLAMLSLGQMLDTGGGMAWWAEQQPGAARPPEAALAPVAPVERVEPEAEERDRREPGEPGEREPEREPEERVPEERDPRDPEERDPEERDPRDPEEPRDPPRRLPARPLPAWTDVVDARPNPEKDHALLLRGPPLGDTEDLLGDPCAQRTVWLWKQGAEPVELGPAERIDGARWLPPGHPLPAQLRLRFRPVNDTSCTRPIVLGGRLARPPRPDAHLCRVDEDGRAWAGPADLSASVTGAIEGETLRLAILVTDAERTPGDGVRVWLGGDSGRAVSFKVEAERVTAEGNRKERDRIEGLVIGEFEEVPGGYEVRITTPLALAGKVPAASVRVEDEDPGRVGRLGLWVGGHRVDEVRKRPTPCDVR